MTARAAGCGMAAIVLASGVARADVWPGATWATAAPESVGMDPALLAQARAYALTGGGAGMVIRSGMLVDSWGDPSVRYELKSSTKSIGALLLGIAVGDGLAALDDPARAHFLGFGVPPPENEATGWLGDVTLRHLATHSAGFDTPAGYSPILHAPGTAWLYSDTGANWLADVLTLVFADDLAAVLRVRVLDPVGADAAQLAWRFHWYREAVLEGIVRRELGSGVEASVDVMARLGYLCLRGGTWDGVPIVPAGFVAAMGTVDPALPSLPNMSGALCPGAPAHYGLLWWTNSDGALAGVPRDAYFSWGLHDSILLVIPSLDVVAARAGDGWRAGWTADYAVLQPFAGPIAQSVVAAVSAPEPLPLRSWGRLHGAFRD